MSIMEPKPGAGEAEVDAVFKEILTSHQPMTTDIPS